MMQEFLHLQSVRDAIDCSLNNYQGFRDSFMANYNKIFGVQPRIDDSLEEDSWYGSILTDGIIASICEGSPLIVKDIYAQQVAIEQASFDGKHYIVPNKEVTRVFGFVSNAGRLRGKIGSEFFNDTSVLDELGVANKIKMLCQEYNCILYGYIENGEFVGTEIADKNNNCVYTKAITDKILEAYHLKQENYLNPWHLQSALNKYGSVFIKLYQDGQLYLYLKQTNIRHKSLRMKIHNTLFSNIENVALLDNEGIYRFLNKHGAYYEYDKSDLMNIILDWKDTIQNLSPEELYQVLNK